MKKVPLIMQLVLLPLSFSVLAEDIPNMEKTPDMEEMIITSSRVLERIDDVPASVTIVNEEQLLKDMLVNSSLQNVLAVRVPGLAPSTGSSSNSGQTLRGRAALVMIDGVPQSTPLRNGALGIRTIDGGALERIEVIKGATSIYGNGAAGGVINYITRRAKADKAISGDIAVSSRFSTLDLEDAFGTRIDATIDGTIEKFSYVVNTIFEDSGVERDADADILGLKYGMSEMESKNYFTKLAYQFDADKSLKLTYNYYEAQQDASLVDVTGSVNSGVKTYAVKDRSGVAKPGDPQGPRGNSNLMLKYMDFALFDNTQMSIDAYDQTIENVFFFSTALSNPDQGYAGGQSMIKSEKSGLRLNFNSLFSWDDLDTTLIYGLDALNDVTSQPLLDGRIWVPEMDMTNVAVYLQTKWVWTDDWIFKLGARRENIDLSVDDYETLRLCKSADVCSVPTTVKGGDLDYEATTYNVGLRYHVNEHFSPFISYSEGFDISDLGRLLRTATVEDIELVQTEASIIDHYEIGFTLDYDSWKLDIAAYQSKSELGTSNEYNAVTGVYVPVRAPQKIEGYEIAAEYNVNEQLNVGATYSYVEGDDTENDKYLDGRQISPPKFTAFLDWQATQNASVSVSYLYVDNRDRFDREEGQYVGAQGPISSYDVVNLNGHLDLGKWQLFAGVENLFNEDYFSARSQAYTYSGYNTKGVGRTLNIGGRYSF